MAQAVESIRGQAQLSGHVLGTWRAAGWMPLVALLGGLICLIYLIATSSMLGAGYDIQRLSREREEWRARNEQLQLELAKVRSLAWVEAQAMTRLGMVKPEKVAYVRLERPANVLALDPPEPVADNEVPARESAGDGLRELSKRLASILPRQP